MKADLEAEGSLTNKAKASGGIGGEVKGDSDSSIEGTVKQEVGISQREAIDSRRYRQTLCPLMAMFNGEGVNQEQKNQLFPLITDIIKGYSVLGKE